MNNETENNVTDPSTSQPVEPAVEVKQDTATPAETPAAQTPEAPQADATVVETPQAETQADIPAEAPAEPPATETPAPVEEAPVQQPMGRAPRRGGEFGNREFGNRGPRAPRRDGGRRGPAQDAQDDGPQLFEKVVFINRCAKVVKGGRRFSFSALVVSGDQEGRVGFGFGKANEVSDAIRKSTESAKKALRPVSLADNTIPHEVYAEFGGGKVLLKPAAPGTGLIAGNTVRAVLEAAGVRDVIAKSLGSSNHANVVKATLKALISLRTSEQVLADRGKKKEKAV